ncbi:protein of unknown function [Enterobacter cancerogenus]|nr:protein of unknown function [Enterobacter cancerogenus]
MTWFLYRNYHWFSQENPEKTTLERLKAP